MEKYRHKENKNKGEENNMALGLLLILFIFLSVTGGVGIILLFWIKNHDKKKWVFYFLSVLGMAIAYISASSFPTNYIGQQLVAWGIGFLSVIALLIHIKANPRFQILASILVSASVILGIAKLFF